MERISKGFCKVLFSALFVLTAIAGQAWDQVGPTVERETFDSYDMELGKESATAVKQDGLWGFINKKGKVTIKPKYEEIGDVQNYEILEQSINRHMPQQLIPVKLNGLWGFVDSRGKEVVKPRYETIGKFSTQSGADYRGYLELYGKCLVGRDGQYYYINHNGKEIESLGAGLTDVFTVGKYTLGIKDGSVAVLEGDARDVKSQEYLTHYFISTPKGVAIRTKEDKVTYPVSNVVSKGDFWLLLCGLGDGTYKAVGNSILPYGPVAKVEALSDNGVPKYFGLYCTDGTFACVDAYDDSEVFRSDKNVKEYFGDDYFSFTEPNDTTTFGIMNAKGDIIAPACYKSLKKGPSKIVVAQKDGKYGVISPDNTEKVPFIYTSISDWGNGEVCVSDGNTIGLFNITTNNWRLPLGKYSRFGNRLWKDRAIWVAKGDKWGVALADLSREIVPPIYSDKEISQGFRTTFDNKNFTVHIKRNGTVSVVNYKGETVIPFGRYSGIVGYHYDYICVSNGKKKGLVNRYTGKQIIPPVHDKIEAEGNGKYLASDWTDTGFIAYIYDANGRVVHKEARRRSSSYANAAFIKDWLGFYLSEFKFEL